jgi:dinuclear metal center YbgI/SA1388 family protein
MVEIINKTRARVLVKDIMEEIEKLAPCELALDYDNVGLLVGSKDKRVVKVSLGLELTDGLLDEAVANHIDMIIVHHPLIFKPIRSIRKEDPTGRKLITLIQHDIALYVAHTNLDISYGGLNDLVMEKLDIVSDAIDCEHLPNIRTGQVKDTSLLELVKSTKEKLGLDYIHYCGLDNKPIKRVGLCTGSGMSYYHDAVSAGVDVYITGDMKYHDATHAIDTGIPIIDATHFGTEIMVSDLFFKTLNTKFGNDLEIGLHTSYTNPIRIL